MLRTALEHDGPIAFRYPRGTAEGVPLPEPPRAIEIGKGEILQEGERVALLGYGWGVQVANDAATILAEHGLRPTVADARFAKPLDAQLVDSPRERARTAGHDRGERPARRLRRRRSSSMSRTHSAPTVPGSSASASPIAT